MLETFAKRDCLIRVISGKGGYGGDTGIKGSWLVFETP